jgi:hypothetical protein
LIHFSFNDFWWFYLAFTCFVFIVLALDLGVFHSKAHEISFKQASVWTTIWIGLAFVFNFFFYLYYLHRFSTHPTYLSIPNFDSAVQAKATALEFLTGFVVEKSLIVFTSNIFAVLGLRSMYFMLAGFMDKFINMKYGLASILIFVGFKMVYLSEAFGGKFPITWSLAIIAALIGSSVFASVVIEKRNAYI